MLPALSKVKSLAKKVICSTRIKQQLYVQFTYHADNNGKFPLHNSWMPYIMKNGDGTIMGDDYDITWEGYYPYIDDPWITICPFRKTKKDEIWGDPYFNVSSIHESGAWRSKVEGTDDAPLYINLAYNWFARSFDDAAQKGEVRFLNGESPWPGKQEECSSNSTLISHLTFTVENGTSAGMYDYSHGGSGWDLSLEFETSGKSLDTPVGRGDGSIISVRRSKMKVRAVYNDPDWYGDVEFYY